MKEYKIKCLYRGAITNEKSIKSAIYYVDYTNIDLDGYGIKCNFCRERTPKVNKERCDLLCWGDLRGMLKMMRKLEKFRWIVKEWHDEKEKINREIRDLKYELEAIDYYYQKKLKGD